MKKLLISLLFFLGFGLINLNAQVDAPIPDSVKPWTYGGTVALNMNQSAFFNWVAGGENSYGANAAANLFANYRKGWNQWDNNLDLGFGLMKQGKHPFFKTDDKIDIASKYGRSVNKYGKWFYSALLGFKTQFYEGRKSVDDTTKTSNIMAPGYLSLALGMDYKPVSNLSVFLSPITARVTFVLDTALSNLGAFGVTPGKKIRFEAGGYIKVIYTQPIGKLVTYNTKLELFSNYLEKPQNIDVNWENTVNFKFSNWLSANFYLTLFYDDDSRITVTRDDGTTYQSARLQIREIFGMGLTFKF